MRCCSSLVPIVETERMNLDWARSIRDRCSSLVPIVETERLFPMPVHRVALRCSSLVPIVETESGRCCDAYIRARQLQFTRSDCGN